MIVLIDTRRCVGRRQLAGRGVFPTGKKLAIHLVISFVEMKLHLMIRRNAIPVIMQEIGIDIVFENFVIDIIMHGFHEQGHRGDSLLPIDDGLLVPVERFGTHGAKKVGLRSGALRNIPDVIPQLFAILFFPVVIPLIHGNHEAHVRRSEILRDVVLIDLHNRSLESAFSIRTPYAFECMSHAYDHPLQCI